MLNLLFIVLMYRLSLVMQMDSQQDLSHLILCKLITVGRVDFNGNSGVKSP